MPVIIELDPGHMGVGKVGNKQLDPGAVGGGLHEAEIVLQIANMVLKYLSYYVVDVRLTRTGNQPISLSDRVNQANRDKANLYISFHLNSSANVTAKGYESYVWSGLKPTAPSFKVQDIIDDEVRGVLMEYGITNRGQRTADYQVLRDTNMDAVLIEVLFISNAEDRKLLTNPKFLDDFAHACAVGIARATGLSKRVVVVSQPVPTPVVTPVAPVQPVQPSTGSQSYRVKVEGVQIGAWSSNANLLRGIEDALNKGAKEVVIQRV